MVPLVHGSRELCNILAHIVQEQCSDFFFKSRVQALEALHMLAVNIIANLSPQIMVGLGHWKVYIDCVHNQQACYFLCAVLVK